MPYYSNGLHLLTGVPAMKLHRAHKSFNNWAQGLSEFLSLISAGSVGDEDLRFLRLDSNVVDKAGILNFNVVIGPFGEQFGGIFEPSLGGAVLHNLNFLGHNIHKNILLK